MPGTGSRKQPEYTLLAVALDAYSAKAEAGINLQLLGPPRYVTDDDEPIHVFGTVLEASGICTYPPGREGDRYDFTLLGETVFCRQMRNRIADLQKRDSTGLPKLRAGRAGPYPLYEEPPPLAYLQKIQGEKRWSAWIWLAAQTVSDSLQILSSARQVYASIYERKVARHRQIRHFSIQTTDPAEE